MTPRSKLMLVSLMPALIFAGYLPTARAQEEQSTGTVEQPDNVTGATTDEGASERAGAGFDTPWTPQPYNDGKADDLEPKPLTATPND